jgi:hypothetical protein
MTTTTANEQTSTPFPGFDAITLETGAHPDRGDALCIMEAVAWMAGEARHTDSPECVCPVIAAFARRFNDARGMTPELRQELLAPLASRMTGTRASLAVMRKRAFLCADFAVRVAAPIALDSRGLGEWATKLRALPEIVDTRSARAAATVTREARRTAATYAATYAAAAAYAAADADADADAAAAAAAYADAAAAAAAYADAAAAAARLNLYRDCAVLLGRLCDVTE